MPIRLQAREVSVSDDELTVLLAYSRRISVPLAWFPRLLHATTAINTVKPVACGTQYETLWLSSEPSRNCLHQSTYNALARSSSTQRAGCSWAFRFADQREQHWRGRLNTEPQWRLPFRINHSPHPPPIPLTPPATLASESNPVSSPGSFREKTKSATPNTKIALMHPRPGRRATSH